MLIRIGQFDITECWDGVLYKKLSQYPRITAWEIQTVLDFIRYEESNGRTCEIEAEKEILAAIECYRPVYDQGTRIQPPQKIEECTACPTYKGCMTDYVCHTSPVENALKILACGKLLSPVRARKISAADLRKESRNAANDPEDYFEHIMFAWGNCQAGDDLPKDKRIEIGLTYVYGIGRKSANDILKAANVNPDTRVKDLTEAEEAALRDVIDKNYTIEGDLRREVAMNIKRLTEIGCYRGVRHRRGLPVRGQRTKTNARTRKGPKKTIANKKK